MRDRVCLVSPNDLTREGLGSILAAENFDVVFSGSSIESLDIDDGAVSMIVICDAFPSEDVAKNTQFIRERYSNSKVVILTEHFDAQSTLECFQAGAKGVIIKSLSSKPLITALRLIALGEDVYPSQMLKGMEIGASGRTDRGGAGNDVADANLSRRELDVLCCLMAGYPNKTIARQLEVCEATVKVHVKAILRKLKVHNRTQAAIWASAHNLPEPAVSLGA